MINHTGYRQVNVLGVFHQDLWSCGLGRNYIYIFVLWPKHLCNMEHDMKVSSTTSAFFPCYPLHAAEMKICIPDQCNTQFPLVLLWMQSLLDTKVSLCPTLNSLTEELNVNISNVNSLLLELEYCIKMYLLKNFVSFGSKVSLQKGFNLCLFDESD